MTQELSSSPIRIASDQSKRMPYFFVSMAAVFPIIVALGFIPDYMMMASNSITPHWFAHVHGAIMTGWLVMFFSQTFLAARGNIRYHRRLGQWGAALGCVVIATLITTMIRRRFGIWYPLEDDVWDIFAIELYSSTLYAVFFTWGMLVRKDLMSHKRLLLLATIIIMGAATDRIRFLPHDSPFTLFGWLDILLVPLFIYDFVNLRKLHRVTIIATVAILSFQTLATFAIGSPTWHNLAFSMFRPFSTPPAETTLNASQISGLLGDYGDKNWHLTIELDHDKIYFTMPGGFHKELGASSETELFARSKAMRLVFARGSDGSATKIIIFEPDHHWEVKRYTAPQ